MDWKEIFGEQFLSGFLVKIVSLVVNLENFNILFKLFDISKDKNKQDFNLYTLTLMQAKLFELIKISEPKNCPNYDDDIIKLLFYLDQKKANIKDLNINFQKILSVKRINEIYIKFY